MSPGPKTSQLQLRVTEAQKRCIQEAAIRAGMDMSAYVLARVLPPAAMRFRELLDGVLEPASYALAALNALLCTLTAAEMADAVAAPPPGDLSPYLGNYVAAMVELGCARRAIRPPAWTRQIAPLDQPVFGTELRSLRLYLLTHSPPPFRRRNIFIDSTLGASV